jgi:ribosome-binding factor A
MDEIRRRRVEEQIRDEIAALIIGGGVKDPRVGPFVSVTRVEAARDLSTARVFVSSFASAVPAQAAEAAESADQTAAPNAGAAPARSGPSKPVGAPKATTPAATDGFHPEDHDVDPALSRAVEGLQNAAGYIQAQVAKRIKLRLTPRLHFIPDRGIKDGFELNERIKGLFS